MTCALTPAPFVRVDGRASTTISRHGAYVLAISTSLPDLVVELHSTYTGHPDCGTQIAELALAGQGSRETLTRSAPHYELPVPSGRQLCLYDHLQRVQELALEAGALDVRIDVLDAALAGV